MSTDALYGIRATRASPPGNARDDEERRRVYGASLAQFDELIAAAEAAGAAARPLPLFYALSQTGRAIAAAHAEGPWRLQGHGLTAPNLAPPLVDVEVKRRNEASRGNKESATVDSFAGVAAATRTAAFSGGATIAALWASLPEFVELPPERSEPRPLLLVPESPDAKNVRMRTDRDHLYAVVVDPRGRLSDLARDLADLPRNLPKDLRDNFPTAGEFEVVAPQGVRSLSLTDYGNGVELKWPLAKPTIPARIDLLDRIAPPLGGTPYVGGSRIQFSPAAGFEPRWLRPAVGGVALSPLLTWWALLFALSMLARYEPVRWVEALDYDSCDLAAPLDKLLTIGLDRVPELVLDALRPRQDAP